jgi:hypothetical protein
MNRGAPFYAEAGAISLWRPVSQEDFCAWLGKAVRGGEFEYHRGFLVIDRDEGTSELDPAERIELTVVAVRAFCAAGQGLVHLLQRRVGPNRFSYLAIRRVSQKRGIPDRSEP